MSGSTPGASGAVCMTTHTATGKSSGKAATIVRSASIPPDEVPTTTILVMFKTGSHSSFGPEWR